MKIIIVTLVVVLLAVSVSGRSRKYGGNRNRNRARSSNYFKVNATVGSMLELDNCPDGNSTDNNDYIWYKLPFKTRYGSQCNLTFNNFTCSQAGIYKMVALDLSTYRSTVTTYKIKSVNCTRNKTLLGGGDHDKKWYEYKNKTRAVRLLVRKVDEGHPYYKTLNARIHIKMTYSCLLDLYKQIAMHCGVDNITRVVKNNRELLESNTDVMRLRNDDRLEVWYEGCGEPTRTKTAMKSVSFLRKVARTFMEVKKFYKSGGGRRNSTGEDIDDAIVIPDYEELYPAEPQDRPGRNGGRGGNRGGPESRGGRRGGGGRRKDDDDEEYFY